ncbi:MalY/PatB family protein [Geobacillus stearothermophilus]|uniref:MalY/PatB family protein n=1 Tax=Geobacillus stearothermophilus TaxID=1422 RepID=UPI0009B8E5E6|nr:MalY/PatB family protein [Geobacillus stearothermophilus]MED3665230.1 pyridoxal phosphate-dependent aminotransferase [Geobacillus stearothermophilus]MED3729686.1 pyridoxal phosphate-dependent aminotransferase [Geobacillus stearothermophilus]MED3734283.1 pyridoxal phosphate-dependent aminotransferase [Geobacillus stearothermophilus]MED3741492.1 pyridoxal phosphate-dependent aminotransferase [Geobacillus stearothermophilus]MED3751174.1 pyridoxal phosphate-dependent aminotransferase [Geobacill
MFPSDEGKSHAQNGEGTAASLFDRVIDRRGTLSVKWDDTKRVFGHEDVWPMWVADMDFPAPPEVQEALQRRVEHGVFGYTVIPDSLKEAVCQWLERRHDWTIDPSWLVFAPGVVPAVAAAIEAFSEPGDGVVVFSPVYRPLFDLVRRHGRTLIFSPLRLAEENYVIDWNDLEAKLPGAKLLILCHPHNPGGKSWTAAELERLGELCLKHGVFVLSDEIHADLTLPPHQHVPFAALRPEFAAQSATFRAPTKTFNLAGLQAAEAVIPDDSRRRAFRRIQQRHGFFTLNAFAVVGAEAAYRCGGSWLDALLAYLQENIKAAAAYLADRLPALHLIRPQATYLIWIDCRGLGLSEEELKRRLLESGKLAVEFGSKFGPEGAGFIRLNAACPRPTLEEGLRRLGAALG